jgi:hypothetical protein
MMVIRKVLIIILSYIIYNHLVVDKKDYDVNHLAIERFKDERHRCIRYIYNRHANKKEGNKILRYIKNYPYVKCVKYKNEYIDYIINKNKIIIYNTLINIIFYINIIVW